MQKDNIEKPTLRLIWCDCDLEHISLNHGNPQISDKTIIINIVEPKPSIDLSAALLLIYGVEKRAKLITVEVATQDKNVNILANFT
jgi:hypothetical protein